jgi:hypothetical protein
MAALAVDGSSNHRDRNFCSPESNCADASALMTVEHLWRDCSVPLRRLVKSPQYMHQHPDKKTTSTWLHLHATMVWVHEKDQPVAQTLLTI